MNRIKQQRFETSLCKAKAIIKHGVKSNEISEFLGHCRIVFEGAQELVEENKQYKLDEKKNAARLAQMPFSEPTE